MHAIVEAGDLPVLQVQARVDRRGNPLDVLVADGEFLIIAQFPHLAPQRPDLGHHAPKGHGDDSQVESHGQQQLEAEADLTALERVDARGGA